MHLMVATPAAGLRSKPALLAGHFPVRQPLAPRKQIFHDRRQSACGKWSAPNARARRSSISPRSRSRAARIAPNANGPAGAAAGGEILLEVQRITCRMLSHQSPRRYEDEKTPRYGRVGGSGDRVPDGRHRLRDDIELAKKSTIEEILRTASCGSVLSPVTCLLK